MDLTAHRRRTKTTIVSNTLNELYPHDINMYKNSPEENVSLAEFEELAVERVELLRIIEQAGLKGHKLFSEDWKKCIKEDLVKKGKKRYVRLMLGGSGANSDLDLQARRADHISHCILRIAYCRSEELRRWFLARELEWFRVKFSSQSPQGIKKFLQLNNMIYTPMSSEDKMIIQEELVRSCHFPINHVWVESNDFYKVPYVDVYSLVRNRKVFLKKGFAYIPLSDLVICVQAKFRAHLSEILNKYQHNLQYVDDDRITSLLSTLHHQYTGNTYTVQMGNKECINPANLDAYAKAHFPLCMRNMHHVLRTNHHLKHGGRLQYGLFLKGIGLLYEDAVTFWREEFTKKMDTSKFEKSYLYNIKHQYGKVGNMVNYSSYSCIKIITTAVGPDERHGCPFKHWDPLVVRQKLLELGASSEAVEEIKQLVSNHHYQIACGKYFEIIHGKAATSGINHPNQYFEESYKIAKDKQNKTAKNN